MTVQQKVSRRITIILPDDLGSDPKFVRMAHPKTKKPTVFLTTPTKLYELKAIDGTNPHSKPNQANKARSLLFNTNWIESEASIMVATPFNPLYLILPALFQTKERFITIDDLHDHIENQLCPDNTEPIPFKLITRDVLELCCDVLEDSMYRLNNDKLLAYLNKVSDRVVSNAPKSMVNSAVHKQLAPMEIEKSTPETVTMLALKQLGMGLISSYLSSEISELWLKSTDFSELKEYTTNLAQQKAAALEAQKQLLNSTTQAGRKRSAPSADSRPKKKAAPAKKSASDSSKSITSFFKKK